MNRISWLAPAALAVALLTVGCSSDYGAEAEDEGTPAIETGGSTDTDVDAGGSSDDGDVAAASDAEMTLASNAYVNDEGVALCPVLNNPIPVVTAATDSREYEGKTYYFC